MDRKNFLKSTLALCGAGMIPATIIQSCSKQAATTPTNVNFTLDLTQSVNAALNNIGGSVTTNGVIVITYASNTYYAYSAACTHEGCAVNFNSNSINCPCHGGTFDPLTGNVLHGPPPTGLTKYKVTKSGNILTVKS